MNKTKRILITILILVVALLLFFFIRWKVINDTSKLLYVVNEDGKTCTITGIGKYKGDTLYLNKPIDGFQVTDIGDSAFENSNIKFVFMPPTLKTIGTRAFANCTSLESVYNLDECTDLKSIGDYAFERCLDINSISLPKHLRSIGNFAFSKCYDLEKIELPDKLLHIGDYAFQGCISLKNIVLPQELKTIGESAFESCKVLSEINIPASVENIGIMAFAGCSQLKKISVDKANYRYSSINGHLYNKNGTIFIQSAPLGISTNFIIPEGVTKIESYAFRGLEFIKSITIPNSINKLNSWVIYGSTKLKTIKFKGTVKEWLSINKNPDWDEGSPEYTIYCTDGQIAKDGTVTYK